MNSFLDVGFGYFFAKEKTTLLLWHCRSQMWSEGCCLMLPKEFIRKITSKFQHLIYFMTSKCLFAITIHILSIRWSQLIFIILLLRIKVYSNLLKWKVVKSYCRPSTWEGTYILSWPSLEDAFYLNKYPKSPIKLLYFLSKVALRPKDLSQMLWNSIKMVKMR